MSPSIGMYPFEMSLRWALEEHYDLVSNRDLIFQLISAPLESLRERFLAGKDNPYLLREKHRRWVEDVREDVGSWISLPSWEDVTSARPGPCSQCYSGTCWCDELHCDMPEWFVYGTDVDIVYELASRGVLSMSDDVTSLLRMALQARPEMTDLLVAFPDVDELYVIRSENVEGCAPEECAVALRGLGDVSDGLQYGSSPTYVLDNVVVRQWIENRKDLEEEGEC